MIAIILIVLIPVVVILLSVFLVSFIRAFLHRVSFYKQISDICNEKGYSVIRPRKILSSFFRYSDKPDLVITKNNENYLIRFITCKNKALFYNFPTPEWYVSFERVLSMPINPTGRFKHLPPFDEKYYSTDDGIENMLIIVFAPQMPKVSYLKDKASKRELSGSSAKMEEWTICSDKYFIFDMLN